MFGVVFVPVHRQRLVFKRDGTQFDEAHARDGADGLDLAARRLAANCRRLVWLNPLMRYDAYAPLAAGAKALSAHAHERRSCHNLATLADLAASLSGDRPRD